MIPAAIQAEFPAARRRAIDAGADPDEVKYLGAGAEGILFLDRGIVYKVGRRKSLANEARALDELGELGAPVPQLVRYDRSNNVVVREHVEGRPGRWADARRLREVYDQEIRPALRAIDFSCGEFKEDSFIIREDGEAIMVDLGFLCPVGKRLVRDIELRMRSLDTAPIPVDSPWGADGRWFDLQSDIRFALSDGDITTAQAREWADEMERVFGPEAVRDLRSLIGIQNPSSRAYLPLSIIDKYVPLMRQLGVSEVARSSRGFLTAYRRAGGDPNKLSDDWRRKRENFIKRHMAQVKKRKEKLWQDGQPTRRHLALIAWAYSPSSRSL